MRPAWTGSVTVAHAATAGAVGLGLVLSAALVGYAASARTTVTTSNPGNTFSTGKVELADDRNGTAMFAAGHLAPGAAGSRCIDVTYSGTLPAEVKLTAGLSAGDPVSALAQFLDFTIQQVDASAATCASALPTGVGSVDPAATTLQAKVNTLRVTPADLAWAPSGAGSETRRYRFSYTLRDDPGAQDTTAAVDFVWTATNVTGS